MTATIPLAASPQTIAIDPARFLAYVLTNTPNTVTVVNLLTNTVGARHTG